MDFDYFYEGQADQYVFYRIPKVLIVEDFFMDLSTDAKLLYGLLLDRVSLSANSGWVDDQKRVYIIYTLRSIERDLHCCEKTAIKLLKELESWNLIERVRQGQGKPSLVYVKNFFGPLQNIQFKTSNNYSSGPVNSTALDLQKVQANNTNINNTNSNNTNPILSGADVDKDEREAYYQYFRNQLAIEIMYERYPYDREVLDALIDILVDAVCSKRKTLRIAGDDKPINVVKSQFMKINSSHVEYVLDSLKSNTTKVRNIKQYILATLYNAPLTMSSYYQAEVNHDFPQYAVGRKNNTT
jgi:hypothetical protein